MNALLSRSAAVLAGLTLAGCSNAGEDLGFGLPTAPGVAAVVYFDRDATGNVTGVDTTFAGITTYLLVAGTNDTVATGTTDGTGLVTFTNVPVGTYAVRVAASVVGDSLQTTLLPATVSVTALGPTPVQQAALAFPVLTVQQIRQAAAGLKVAVAGVILAGRQSFADTSAHIEDSTGALRLLSVTNRNGGPVNFPGEAVRVTGVVATSGGQPVLSQAFVTLVGPGPGPLAVDTITTQEAAAAGAGSRDADLVFVPGGQIVDTATVGTAFRVRMDDGSGVLEVLFDLPAGFPLAAAIPGDSLDAGGVLVPAGAGVWRLKPRVAGDIRIF